MPGKQQEPHYYQQRGVWLGTVGSSLGQGHPSSAWKAAAYSGAVQRLQSASTPEQSADGTATLHSGAGLPSAVTRGASGVWEGCWSGVPGGCQVQGHFPSKKLSSDPTPALQGLTSNVTYRRKLTPKCCRLAVQVREPHSPGILAHNWMYLQPPGISGESGARISESCWWSPSPQITGRPQSRRCCPRCTQALHCVVAMEVTDRQRLSKVTSSGERERDP